MENNYDHSQVINGGKSEDNRINHTNHIYLHPGHHSGEFENWMQKIGGLIQIKKEYLSLKPLLEMIAAVLEPSRIFLIPYGGIEKLHVNPSVEVILVLNDNNDSNYKKLVEGFLDVACVRHSDVMINIFSEDEWNSETEDEHLYFTAHCRSKFLVFSGSPYRILEPNQESIQNVQEEIANIFKTQVTKSMKILEQSEVLYNEQTNSDLLYGIASVCIKQFYRMVTMPFLLDIAVLNRSCDELEKMASRIIPQARNLSARKIDMYTQWENEDLEEDIRRDAYLPKFADLQKYFEILKVAFEQKMTVLFETN